MKPVSSYAADYIRQGFPVLPLKSGSKVPATRHGKADASADADQVAHWFAEGSNRNIGILTGEQSGLLLIDIDPRNGGTESFARLLATHGGLPATRQVKTGGGGTHYYFGLPADIGACRDRPNVQGHRGVDLKADGYAVAPPSVHPDTGKSYEWENDLAIAPAPDWLVAMVKTASTKAGASPQDHNHQSSMLEGARNSTLCSVAGVLRSKGANEDAITGALKAMNAAQCVPPLDEVEVEGIARSVARYAPGSPFPDTDVGNARRLVAALDRNARYDHASRSWYFFDGRVWQRDNDGAIIRAAKAVGDQLLAGAQQINDPDHRKRKISFAVKTQSATRIRAMAELAQSEDGIPIAAVKFDRQANLLNARNGTIDLRTGRLLPHDRQHLLTRLADVDFDPLAQCPTFETFLRSVFEDDAELIEFVHRVIGYCTTGETREQLFLVLHGDGANGKSTLLKAISDALGPYAAHTPTETLLARNGGPSNDLARLMGARFVTASEADAHQRLNESLIKQVTGDEPLTARYLYGEFFTFKPVFKLALATNALPQVNGADPALFRRLRLIPFNRVFTQDEQDKSLGAKLDAELPGILAWIVRGAVKWYSDGLTKPAAVVHAGAEFRADSDTVATYIEDRCEPAPGEVIQASHLFRDYRRFTEDAGRSALTQTAFGRVLTRRGITAEKRGGASYRSGIKFRSSLAA